MSSEQLDAIEHNLTNHPPRDENVTALFDILRDDAKEFARTIAAACPTSREKSLALTNLEQALMWAVAAVARNQHLIPPAESLSPEERGRRIREHLEAHERAVRGS